MILIRKRRKNRIKENWIDLRFWAFDKRSWNMFAEFCRKALRELWAEPGIMGIPFGIFSRTFVLPRTKTKKLLRSKKNGSLSFFDFVSFTPAFWLFWGGRRHLILDVLFFVLFLCLFIYFTFSIQLVLTVSLLRLVLPVHFCSPFELRLHSLFKVSRRWIAAHMAILKRCGNARNFRWAQRV